MAWPDELQYVKDSSGNVVGLANGNSTIGLASTYTWATKPLASSYIGTAFISDIGGGTYWVSNGVRWKPLNGRCTLYTMPAAGTPTTCNLPTNLMQCLIKAGVLQTSDKIIVRLSGRKSSTVETSMGAFTLSTVTTAGDTPLYTATSLLSGANVSIGIMHEYKIVDDTHVIKLGNHSTADPYNGSGTAAPASVTVSSVATNDLYFSFYIDSSAGVETYYLEDCSIELISQI